MKRKLVSIGIVIMLMVFVVSCATFERNTYRTMYISGTSYDTGMKVVSKLQSQGAITLAQRLEINKVANVFYVSYQVAVDAFETWKKSQTQAAKDILITVLSTMEANWVTYTSYVNRLAPGTLPATLEEVK